MTPDERDRMAAEWVLGTLDTVERSVAADLIDRDPAFAAAVRAWEDRLAPLDADTAPLAPPAAVWSRIDVAISGQPLTAEIDPVEPHVDAGERLIDSAGIADVIDLRARLGRWRATAAAAMAAAAALAAVAVIDRLPQPVSPDTGRFLAVVNTDGTLPAMVVDVDTARGIVTVRAVAMEQPSDRSLELWAIPEGGQPVSLGLVDPATAVQRFRPEVSGTIPTRGQFAVSVEPPGGSPTGAPTGPVIYSGILVPADG